MDNLSFWVISFMVIFTAFFLKGLTGFGASLILMPFLSLFIDIKTAVVIACLADVSSSFIFMIKRRKNIKWLVVRNVGSGLAIGTLIGVNIFQKVDGSLLKRILGIFIISYIALPFLLKNVFKNTQKGIFGTFAGFIGGICGGIFNTNGPPIVMYITKALKSKLNIRSTLLTIFFFDSVWRVSLYSFKGFIDSSIVKYYVLAILPSLLLGVYAAGKMDSKLKSNMYIKIVRALLFVTGLNMVFR